MKRKHNLYNSICNLNDIVEMTNKVCTKVKNKNKVEKFERYKTEHIVNIYNRIYKKTLDTGKYNIFMITDPKCRIVMAQEIEDKILNHLVAEKFLVNVFDNKLTNNMYATRRKKGTLYGIKYLKKYLNEIKNKYENFYYLKIDISKYFYSIDHDVLKKILLKKIKDKDAINLLFKIIDSTNQSYINEKIKKLKQERITYLKRTNLKNKDSLIKEVNEIPFYNYKKRVALGSQTSQMFGLIYLYEIIHFMKEKLHLKYVCNYMDDFVILHHDKKYLKYCLGVIESKLLTEYSLKINPKKTRIDSIKNGIDFLGYHFYVKNNKIIMKVRNSTKKNFKKKIKNNSNSLSSYKGLLKYGNCKSLYYRTMNK